MKVIIIGGTGLIGSQVAKILGTEHEVVAASPNTGVNTLTGEGLEQALQNADIVIDVSNSPSFADDDVLHFSKTSNENLLPAAKKAGVQHLVALSVVGTDRMQDGGYFRAKQVQEDMIKASGLPYTIVHATQFFEFAGGIAAMSTAGEKVKLSTAFIQPIASAEVASFIAKTAVEKPANAIIEIGGPERFQLNEWIAQYANATQKTFAIKADNNAPYSGVVLKQETLVPENPVFLGSVFYEDWIANPDNQR